MKKENNDSKLPATQGLEIHFLWKMETLNAGSLMAASLSFHLALNAYAFSPIVTPISGISPYKESY